MKQIKEVMQQMINISDEELNAFLDKVCEYLVERGFSNTQNRDFHLRLS
jgi:hypothetical protein